MSVRLRQGLGAAIRAARLRQVRTAEEFAALARYLGLGWQRQTVSMIESGRRALTPEELFLLPLMFGGRVTLAELLGERMALTSAVETTPDGFREVLSGERPTIEGCLGGTGFRLPDSLTSVYDWDSFLEPGSRLSAALALMYAVDPAAYGPDINFKGAVASLLFTHWFDQSPLPGEADRKVARRLSVSPYTISDIAYRLFGRGFTQERDARAVAEVGEGADTATLRAARRRASMRLSSEVRAALSREKVDVRAVRRRASDAKH